MNECEVIVDGRKVMARTFEEVPKRKDKIVVDRMSGEMATVNKVQRVHKKTSPAVNAPVSLVYRVICSI